MNELLRAFGITNVVGFVLVLARVTPLFLVAPLFSSRQLTGRARTVSALALTIGLLPLALEGQEVPPGLLAIVALVLKELLVGLAFAVVLAVLMAAIETAGALLDVLIGFSFGAVVDPMTGNQGAVLSRVYTLVGIAIFIVIGGDAWVISGLSRTFDLVPLTASPDFASLAEGVVAVCTTLFVSALEVFAVGFPVKVVVGLLVVAASLPFVAGWLGNELELSVGEALRTLRVA
jgi:flagellar biosynthetic protein FliR